MSPAPLNKSNTGRKNAVILLSGGLDSATCLAIAKSEGFECYALSFAYGQRNSCELKASGDVAASIGVADHVVIDIDLRKWGGSALTDDIDVPFEVWDTEDNKQLMVSFRDQERDGEFNLIERDIESCARDIFEGNNVYDRSSKGCPEKQNSLR